jgi:hypothetical protein
MTSSWFEFFYNAGILGAYLSSIFWLPNVWLKHQPRYSIDDFKTAYPKKARWVVVHDVLSWVAVFGIPAGFIAFGHWIPGNEHFAFFMLVWFSGISFFNAAFEIITGISPRFGAILRRYDRQSFYCGGNVRRLGVTRLLLTATVAALMVYL